MSPGPPLKQSRIEGVKGLSNFFGLYNVTYWVLLEIKDTRKVEASILEKGEGLETRVHTYYGDVMAHTRHGSPLHTSVQFNTSMTFVALYSLVYDNQSRTKRKVIEEVNHSGAFSLHAGVGFS